MRLYPSSVLGTMTSVGAVSVVHFFLSLVSSIIFFVMADMVRQRGKKKEKEVACAYPYCNRWNMGKEWRKVYEMIAVNVRAKVVDGCVPLSMN